MYKRNKDNKFWLRPGYKKNVRYRCRDCNAQFRSATEETKFMLHFQNMSGGGHDPRYLHSGFIVATAPRGEGDFYFISDAVTYMRKIMEEDG